MPQTHETIVEQVRRTVAEVLQVTVEEVALDRPFAEMAETDSLTLAEMASSLDAAFFIHIDTPSISGARTPADLVALVKRLLEIRLETPR